MGGLPKILELEVKTQDDLLLGLANLLLSWSAKEYELNLSNYPDPIFVTEDAKKRLQPLHQEVAIYEEAKRCLVYLAQVIRCDDTLLKDLEISEQNLIKQLAPRGEDISFSEQVIDEASFKALENDRIRMGQAKILAAELRKYKQHPELHRLTGRALEEKSLEVAFEMLKDKDMDVQGESNKRLAPEDNNDLPELSEEA